MSGSKNQARLAKRQKRVNQKRVKGGLTLLVIVAICVAVVWLVVLGNKPAEALASEEIIEIGRQVYQETCAACHGDQGQGHILVQAPALDETEHAWHHPDGQIQRIIQFGGATMPAFGEDLSTDEIEAVLRYVQTLWQADQLASQQTASRQDPFVR